MCCAGPSWDVRSREWSRCAANTQSSDLKAALLGPRGAQFIRLIAWEPGSISGRVKRKPIHFYLTTLFSPFQTNLTELRSFGSPPSAVSNVTAAVMVLTAPGGKIPKDRSWKAARVAMARVDSFLDSLIKFNKENIHENCLRALQPYLQDPRFNPESVATKSAAAAGLCSWVLNIARFHRVFCEVQPKRQALDRANAELAAAQDKLATVKAKIAVSDLGGTRPACPCPGESSALAELPLGAGVLKQGWESRASGVVGFSLPPGALAAPKSSPVLG